MKKRFKLIKETLEAKIGAIFEEKCEDGDQHFDCITKDKIKHTDQKGITYTRQTMEQKEWFKEITLLWLTNEQIKKLKNIIKE